MWGKKSNYVSIGGYNQAKHTYEDTKPLRNTADTRPLDRRSKNAKTFIKKQGDDYIIQLYRTDIVIYKADGSVELNSGRWVTTSTAVAMSAFSPFACWISKGHLVVRLAIGEAFIIPSKGLVVRLVNDRWVPVNPVKATVTRTRVRKEEAKKVRALFKQVPIYIKTLGSAFKGGVKPVTQKSQDVVSYSKRYIAGTPLTDDEVLGIAWLYVSARRAWNTSEYLILGNTKTDIAAFWREVYAELGLIETYHIDLPYGVAP